MVTGKELQQKVHVDRLKAVIDRNWEQAFCKNAGTQQNRNTINQRDSTDIQGKETEVTVTAVPVTKYKIVEQRGYGINRRFRIQWRDNEGKYHSQWDLCKNVTKELIEAWEKTHGKTGKTLAVYKRKRNY